MYVNYEISYSWMLTSAGFDLPEAYKRPVKRDEQGHVLLFLRSICTLRVCWALHKYTASIFYSQHSILHAGLIQASRLDTSIQAATVQSLPF